MLTTPYVRGRLGEITARRESGGTARPGVVTPGGDDEANPLGEVAKAVLFKGDPRGRQEEIRSPHPLTAQNNEAGREDVDQGAERAAQNGPGRCIDGSSAWMAVTGEACKLLRDYRSQSQE